MEITTILGIIVGVASVIGAMIFKGIPFSVFNNKAAIFVIFVGTAGTILNAFRGKDLSKLGALFKILFTTDKSSGNSKKIVDTILELATAARKDGLLSLESKLSTIDDVFMRKAFKMMIDGADEHYVSEVLYGEIDAMKERHASYASIFSQMGMYAPTLGVLGAVFGLIAAMNHIEDTGAMAEAVAAAFIATILGIFTGYVLWNPFANKLKIKSKAEAFEKTMIVEGALAIQRGEHPIRIKERLLAMLSKTEQSKLGGDE